MKIILKVDLNIEGSREMKAGEFSVRKEDDIPAAAYSWIRSIKMETGCRETEIERVTWNQENDITDKVRKIDDAPLL